MNKKTIIILSIIGLLALLRIFLPTILLKQVNKILADMEEYTGHVGDLDLNLYRGALELENIKIEKINAKVKEPFVDVKEIDVSVDWNAVFNGKFAGEIIMDQPRINFAIDSTGEESQTGEEVNWAETLDELVPIDVNLNVFQVKNGTVQYADYSQRPNIKAQISFIELTANNLSNVKPENEDLPAKLRLTANTDGNGQIKTQARLNFLKEVPDFDLNFELKNIELTELNEFAKAYGNFDMEDGSFSMFSEIYMKDNNYDGYVKPLFENIKIIDYSKEKDDSFFQKVWETMLSVPFELLENQKKDRIASKIPLKGSIEKSETEVFKSIVNLLKNAFVKAIPKKLENSIEPE